MTWKKKKSEKKRRIKVESIKAKISKPLAVGDEQKTAQDFLHLHTFAFVYPSYLCFHLHLLPLVVIHIRTEKDKELCLFILQ